MFVETIVLPRREWERVSRSACGSRTIHPKLRDALSLDVRPFEVVALARRARFLIRWSWSGLKLSDRCRGRCRSRYGAVDAGVGSAVSAATNPVANPWMRSAVIFPTARS